MVPVGGVCHGSFYKVITSISEECTETWMKEVSDDKGVPEAVKGKMEEAAKKVTEAALLLCERHFHTTLKDTNELRKLLFKAKTKKDISNIPECILKIEQSLIARPLVYPMRKASVAVVRVLHREERKSPPRPPSVTAKELPLRYSNRKKLILSKEAIV
jgi:hypothetical protein